MGVISSKWGSDLFTLGTVRIWQDGFLKLNKKW